MGDWRQGARSWTGAAAVVQGRDVDPLNKGWNNGNGEKWSGSGYILEVKQTGLDNGVDVGNEGKRGLEDDS